MGEESLREEPMPAKPKIGQYRHTPGSPLIPGPDGTLRPARTKRRFPFMGVVVLGYAIFGPLVCAGVSALFNVTGLAAYMPKLLSGKPLPPSPSMQNVLFGAGLHEMVVACAVVGWLTWRTLWGVRVPHAQQQLGPRGVVGPLLFSGLLLGPLFTLFALPIGVFGQYIRTAPTDQPWIVRPFFALIAALVAPFSAFFTLTIPLVLVLLGLLMGSLTAVAVAFLWREFPEEPVHK